MHRARPFQRSAEHSRAKLAPLVLQHLYSDLDHSNSSSTFTLHSSKLCPTGMNLPSTPSSSALSQAVCTAKKCSRMYRISSST